MSEIPTHEIMQANAADAVSYAMNKFGIVLDYSEQSLVRVDELLAQMTSHGLLKSDELSEKQSDGIWALCEVIGGYIGAVIIKHIGAQWETEEVGDKEVIIKLKVAGRVTVLPHEKVWKRLTESETDMIIGYYRALQHMLGLKKFLSPELEAADQNAAGQHHDVMNYFRNLPDRQPPP